MFFLRIWRNWIKTSSHFNLIEIFIMLNTYTELDIEAHSLLLLTWRPKFMKLYLGSQACEKRFRAARSFTFIFSIIINSEVQKNCVFFFKLPTYYERNIIFPKQIKTRWKCYQRILESISRILESDKNSGTLELSKNLP